MKLHFDNAKDAWNLPLYQFTQTVRIFTRSEFADCYVDDKFIFSTVVDDAPLSGKIGFAVDSAAASFFNLRVASLEAE